jgi:hypothetical protein
MASLYFWLLAVVTIVGGIGMTLALAVLIGAAGFGVGCILLLLLVHVLRSGKKKFRHSHGARTH